MSLKLITRYYSTPILNNFKHNKPTTNYIDFKNIKANKTSDYKITKKSNSYIYMYNALKEKIKEDKN